MRQFSQRGDLVKLQDSRGPFQQQLADEKHAVMEICRTFLSTNMDQRRRRYRACNIEGVLDGVMNLNMP